MGREKDQLPLLAENETRKGDALDNLPQLILHHPPRTLRNLLWPSAMAIRPACLERQSYETSMEGRYCAKKSSLAHELDANQREIVEKRK